MSALHSCFAPILSSVKYVQTVITDTIFFTLKPRDPASINTQTMYDNGAQITPQPYFQRALKVAVSGWNQQEIGELWVAVAPWGTMEHGRSFACRYWCDIFVHNGEVASWECGGRAVERWRRRGAYSAGWNVIGTEGRLDQSGANNI